MQKKAIDMKNPTELNNINNFDDSAYMNFTLEDENTSNESFEIAMSNTLIDEVANFIREHKLSRTELWHNLCAFFTSSQNNVNTEATEPLREVMMFLLQNKNFLPNTEESVLNSALEKLRSSFLLVYMEEGIEEMHKLCEERCEQATTSSSNAVKEIENAVNPEKEQRNEESLKAQRAILSTVSWKRFLFPALPILITGSITLLTKLTYTDITGLIEMGRNVFTAVGAQPETKKAIVEITKEVSLYDIYQVFLRDLLAYLKKDDK